MDDLFFILSKIAWGVLRADSLVILLIGAGVVALVLGHRFAGAGLVLFALVTILAVALSPLSNRLLLGLESRHSVPEVAGPVAGIVVLGGAEDPFSTAEWGVPRSNEAGSRFLVALDLARRFPEAAVMFTGGSGNFRASRMPEAEVARRILTGAGLDESRLILESASRNTAENARLGAAVVPGRAGAWLLVTSAFHMPRSVEAFCAAGWQEVVPYPVDFRSSRGPHRVSWKPAESFVRLNTALREYLGLAAYRMTGRAAHPLPAGCLAGR